MSSQSLCRVPVWDLPTRIFHWLTVILIAGGWLSQQYGDFQLTWHKWNGYLLLTLLVFRMLWGVVGSSTARFSHFFAGPLTVWRYLRQPGHQPSLGHNPLGSLSVFALLGLMLAQAVSGLFATDDIFFNGPLRAVVSSEVADWLDQLHRHAYDWLLVLVGLHISAVLFYRLVRRDNLIKPMVTGYKCPEQVPAGEQARWQPLWLALVCLAVAALLVWAGLNAWHW